MEDVVAALREVVDELAIADVALDELEAPGLLCLGDVVPRAADEVVDDADLLRAPREELIGDVRAHEARSAGHEDGGAFDRILAHDLISLSSSNAAMTVSCSSLVIPWNSGTRTVVSRSSSETRSVSPSARDQLSLPA